MGKMSNLVIVVITMYMVGCATTSRLYTIDAPENARRLVEVMGLSTKLDIPNNRYIYEPLEEAGIQDAGTRDGSIGIGRIYCCGGKMDEAFFHYVYIPADIKVEVGDIAEIKTGSLPEGGKSSVNTILRVVQKRDDPADTCRWEPREWVYDRVLYCDWMPEEGWVQYRGKTWVKLK